MIGFHRLARVVGRVPVGRVAAPSQARSISLNKMFTKTSALSHESDHSIDGHVEDILANNKRWVASRLEEDPLFFKTLAKPQKPKYLYFGCSDSRVPANEILGLAAGEVFVHRNIGNLVPGNDLNALSVLEYAVTHLGVTDIIVTGHYDCGAIRAATQRQDLGLLENWLRQIRDVYRLHKDYLDLIDDDEVRHLTLVELNVIEQCLNLYKTGVVQRARQQARQNLREKSIGTGGAGKGEVLEKEVFPRIHGLVFNPAEGLLKKLPVNFHKRVGSLDHIYGLYGSLSDLKSGH
mmetsp:Transcript_33101/g.72925  ORF Transcript_33101/g.72925 Transcript_33101/m.72925 type:complete len:292 (+) Transcript_33101:123-998(+)